VTGPCCPVGAACAACAGAAAITTAAAAAAIVQSGAKLPAHDSAVQQPLLASTSSHLASMAAAGYRTLVVAGGLSSVGQGPSRVSQGKARQCVALCELRAGWETRGYRHDAQHCALLQEQKASGQDFNAALAEDDVHTGRHHIRCSPAQHPPPTHNTLLDYPHPTRKHTPHLTPPPHTHADHFTLLPSSHSETYTPQCPSPLQPRTLMSRHMPPGRPATSLRAAPAPTGRPRWRRSVRSWRTGSHCWGQQQWRTSCR